MLPLFADDLTYTFPSEPSSSSASSKRYAPIRLLLRQQPSSSSTSSSSSQSEHRLFADNVWPGSRALADYLATHPHTVEGKRVLELGAGSALPSLTALRIGANLCVASDYPEPSILANIEQAFTCNFSDTSARWRVVGHKWGQDCSLLIGNLGVAGESSSAVEAGYDVVLLSEVLWRDTYALQDELAASFNTCLARHGIGLLSLVHRPCADHSAERDLEFFARLAGLGMHSRFLTSAEGVEAGSGGSEMVSVQLFCITRGRQ